MLRRVAQSLVLTALLVLVAPAAWAVTVTFNFAEEGETLETGYAAFVKTISGLTLTATANGSNLVYLDGPLGGPGGMGVCKELSGGECDPSDDDNLSIGEELTLSFDDEVRIDEIKFRDCTHGTVFDCDEAGTDDLPNTPLGGPFVLIDGTSYALGSSLALGGPFASSFTFGYVNEKYYISEMTVTTREGPEEPPPQIPEPTSLALLGTGLLGLRARRRRG